MIRVLVVDNEPMARSLLEIVVNKSEGCAVVGAMESARYVESFCCNNNVNAVVIDACTAFAADGVTAIAAVKKRFSDIKVIIISRYPEISFLKRAQCVDADGFWYKTIQVQEIISVIEKTIAGERVFPLKSPVIRLGNTTSDKLSKRELEVLRMIVAGKTDAEISERLYITVSSVKFHIRNLKIRTGFRNRTELAVKARESGLIINLD